MKLIDRIIKMLINFKYKKEHFLVWSWGIDDIHHISVITGEYYFDHYRYGIKEVSYMEEGVNDEDCKE